MDSLEFFKPISVMKASDVQEGGSHYKRYVIQPTEFIFKNGLGFIEGNVIKYVMRHREKNGKHDLLKAKHYIDLLLEYEYPDKEAPVLESVDIKDLGSLAEKRGGSSPSWGTDNFSKSLEEMIKEVPNDFTLGKKVREKYGKH